MKQCCMIPKLKFSEYAFKCRSNKKQIYNITQNMKRNGYMPEHPIVMYQGKILDGRARYIASQSLGIAANYIEYNGDDPASFVYSSNMCRTNYTESQIAVIAVRLMNLLENNKIGEIIK